MSFRVPRRSHVSTTAAVRLEQPDGRFTISQIDLQTLGEVEGVSPERFPQLAAEAERTCPVPRAFATPEITIDVRLAGT